MLLQQSTSKSEQTWEDKFKTWSTGPSKTEEERCENAIKMITDAIKASEKLKNRDVRIFLQGSYRNKVNVRSDSDVDIGVVCKDVFYAHYPKGYNRDSFGYVEGGYSFTEFKNDIEEALVSKFGRAAVTRGNKAFDIKANSYRVEADVAPFMEHRRFRTDGSYIEGVQQFSDDGKKLVNWPEQHYENGVSKNISTSRKYKRTVRVLKKLKIEMADNGYLEDISGFFCECLIWNVPNIYLSDDSYYNILKRSIAFLYHELDQKSSDEWGEVSELKYLFTSSSKITKNKAQTFLLAAWNYIGYK